MIPVYLSHSYWPEDREINQFFWKRFWEEGFAFTVDPKSTDHLSIPHLELMMHRSACFVAIVPYRADQQWYRTSPYIVFEHNMAVRARKPLLVLAESQVAGHPFDHSRLSVFRRADPGSALRLPELIRDLRGQSIPYAQSMDHVLGSVGLILPPGRVYDRSRAAIRGVLEAAGYRVEELGRDGRPVPDFTHLDRHDFLVLDIRDREMASGTYYRFVPTIRLGHVTAAGVSPAPPRAFHDEALDRAGESAQNVIWWRTEDELVARLQPLVDKMQRPRREFRSHDEGVGYFQSLGRTLRGPVFISNARRQNELARHLSRSLDLGNIPFFHYRYKNSIPMGTEWESQLLQHLRSSSLFVPLITSDYWQSDMCRREFELAEQLSAQGRLRIYKYFLDDALSTAGLTERLQGGDLVGFEPDEQVRRVVTDIDRYLTMGEHLAS